MTEHETLLRLQYMYDSNNPFMVGRRKEIEIAMKAIKELEAYRAIGTVEEIRFMKSACEMNDEVLNGLANSVREKMKYEAIGTVEEFKALKDAEEQGLFLKLPCKVDDIAYYVHREYCDRTKKWTDHIDEVIVDSFVLNVNLFVNVSLYIGGDRFGKTLTPYKTLFFTREEAEQALKDMKNN